MWTDLDRPRAITVHAELSLMFWSDWGVSPKIERAAVDGSNRSVIVASGIVWPNALALDTSTNSLCWADGKTGNIEVCTASVQFSWTYLYLLWLFRRKMGDFLDALC